ncbi:hypothetical protein LCGC14_0856910 [marine sediment metagenome]|uniref:Uncharacterized protein n=1 Tax=marine sediment metagenome TaxID=412755 RepID=A0A0F9P8H4_9ZZZZ
MPPITPNKSVGSISGSDSMKVVICPTCRKKRWANRMKKPSEYRTTCCGTIIT